MRNEDHWPKGKSTQIRDCNLSESWRWQWTSRKEGQAYIGCSHSVWHILCILSNEQKDHVSQCPLQTVSTRLTSGQWNTNSCCWLSFQEILKTEYRGGTFPLLFLCFLYERQISWQVLEHLPHVKHEATMLKCWEKTIKPNSWLACRMAKPHPLSLPPNYSSITQCSGSVISSQ